MGRRVAEDAGLASIVRIEILIARPQGKVLRSLARMFAVIEPCMNIDRVIVFVIDRQPPEKVQMLGGDFFRQIAARLFKIFLRLKTQGPSSILLEGTLAARRGREPDERALLYALQEHLFMI